MSATIDLADPQRNGVYLVDETDLADLEHAARAQAHRVCRIDLAACRGKAPLLERIAAALEFPDTFGANWDALADCLRDLAWLPGTGGIVLLFDHAEALRDAAEQDFDSLCDILQDAGEFWKASATPFFAFLAMPDETLSGPPAA